jgi:hypothetical protein
LSIQYKDEKCFLYVAACGRKIVYLAYQLTARILAIPGSLDLESPPAYYSRTPSENEESADPPAAIQAGCAPITQ